MALSFAFTDEIISRLSNAVKCKLAITGLTHNFYRYPARFSPQFVKEIINTLSRPGDVIFDPFMGGGTTLIEACANGRHAIGIDISPIATFVSKAKTTVLSEKDFENIEVWIRNICKIKLVSFSSIVDSWEDEGYKDNMPVALKKIVQLFLSKLSLLKSDAQKNFTRCCILKTSQWAMDCRKEIPSVKEFRNKIIENFRVLKKGLTSFEKTINDNSTKPVCIALNGSAENINNFTELKLLPAKPKLIITSPPYVGVQILYHQWQVQGRRRSRAPFWIVDAADGHGSQHYTFGHYKSHTKALYFESAKNAFIKIKNVIDKDALVVQLIGFSDHKKFLPKYLDAMTAAGFEEVSISHDKLGRTKRLWRKVPNRKWYFRSKETIIASKEVLLIHRIKK